MEQTFYYIEVYDKESGRYYTNEVYSKVEAQEAVFKYIAQGYFARIVEKEMDVVQEEFKDCFELLCNQMGDCINCPRNRLEAEDCLERACEDAKTDEDKLLIITKMIKAAVH